MRMKVPEEVTCLTRIGGANRHVQCFRQRLAAEPRRRFSQPSRPLMGRQVASLLDKRTSVVGFAVLHLQQTQTPAEADVAKKRVDLDIPHVPLPPRAPR